ncbi:hypothetical protein [Maribellus maritimus]|uniref:hypothetical protein n=1 Tax=Maribellus maritimus TaxID=2870838 RepID=UPI001EEA38DC|nr:hypothetical protein [Maribellus maritimus]MCG6186807.1 hypothetical protein [Maribellus maritimus]
MELKEIKRLLQLYFNGESTLEDERKLEAYFSGGDVADELKEYAEFFGGISELSELEDDPTIEDDVMDYILENEHQEKTKYRSMWKTVTGIAASVIIVLGGFLFYQQQNQQPFEDTFDDPEVAYAYVRQTMQYVSGKYSEGLAELSNFEKLQVAAKPIKEGVRPVNEFFDEISRLKAEDAQVQSNTTEDDSIKTKK